MSEVPSSRGRRLLRSVERCHSFRVKLAASDSVQTVNTYDISVMMACQLFCRRLSRLLACRLRNRRFYSSDSKNLFPFVSDNDPSEIRDAPGEMAWWESHFEWKAVCTRRP